MRCQDVSQIAAATTPEQTPPAPTLAQHVNCASCKTPSRACATSLNLVSANFPVRGSSSPTNPCPPPTGAGCPLPQNPKRFGIYSKNAPSISSGLATPCSWARPGTRGTVGIEPLVGLVGPGADARHHQRRLAGIAELIVTARRQHYRMILGRTSALFFRLVRC